jgi:hypothetical protein
MSFWDIAATAASIYAGATLGPWAGAAVGGGINALRGEDILGGAVSGYLGGLGGSDIAGAMDSTAAAAKAAGTNVGTINNAMLSNAGVLGPQATMTGFGGASGINSLPGATSNIATSAGNFGNAQNINTSIGGGNLTGPGGNFSSSCLPIKTPVPRNLIGGANPNANFGSVQGMKPGVNFANMSNTQPIADFPGGGGFTNTTTSPFNTYADQSISGRGGIEQISTDFVDTYNPSINKGLQNTEVGANFNKPNTAFKPGENYSYLDQKTVVPEGGFSWEDRFSAVSDNPGQFLDDLGGGGEYGKLIGGGKLALTGAGLVAPMFAEDYGVDEGYTSTFDDTRFRGDAGQLNLSGDTNLRLYGGGGTVQPQAGGGSRGGGGGVNNLLRNMMEGTAQNMQTTGVPEGMTIADVMMAARGYNSAGEKLAGGGYLSGGGALGDGMSDDIPAMIGNNQPAALSEGEFVIPADVVSHLGNGSSNAGSKRLYAMMDQVRKDRTGTEKQGNQIDPRRYMPA